MFLLKIIYIFDSFFSYQIPRFSKLINIILKTSWDNILQKFISICTQVFWNFDRSKIFKSWDETRVKNDGKIASRRRSLFHSLSSPFIVLRFSLFFPSFLYTYMHTHTPHITPERIAQPLKDKQSCIVRGERYVKQGRSLWAWLQFSVSTEEVSRPRSNLYVVTSMKSSFPKGPMPISIQAKVTQQTS